MKRLAGGNIPNNFKTQSGDGHAFTGDDVFAYAFDLSLAKDQWPDTVWVPECKQSIARDNGNAGIASMNTIVDRRDGTKNGLNVDVGVALMRRKTSARQVDGQGVEEKFGIAGGVDMRMHSSRCTFQFLALVKFPLCARQCRRASSRRRVGLRLLKKSPLSDSEHVQCQHCLEASMWRLKNTSETRPFDFEDESSFGIGQDSSSVLPRC